MTYTDKEIQDAIAAIMDRGQNKADTVRKALEMLRITLAELTQPVGTKFLFGAGLPPNSKGVEGDVYDNILTTDRYSKQADGTWKFQYRVKGEPGRTPEKGKDYNDGYTPQKPADYRDGRDAKNVYELWLEAGNVGTLATFMDWYRGNSQPGQDGADGTICHVESFDPAATDGNDGDLWNTTVSLTTERRYKKTNGVWRKFYDNTGATVIITPPNTAPSVLVQVAGTATVPRFTAQAADADGVQSIFVKVYDAATNNLVATFGPSAPGDTSYITTWTAAPAGNYLARAVATDTKGLSATSDPALAFTVTAAVGAPTIASFTPLSGLSGSVVTVTGTNLASVTTATFAGVAVLGITNNTATSVTLLVPATAATGRITVTTAGGTATSASSFTVTTSTKLHLIVGFGNSQTYGPVGSGDSLIGSAGHEAWMDVMLADLNANGVQYAGKVFGHPGYTTTDLLGLLQTEVKPWLDANASQYATVTVILQELVNEANNHNPAFTEDQVYSTFAQLITNTKALSTVNSVSMLTGYVNTAGSSTNGLITNVNTRLKESRNALGVKQVFDVRTLKYVLDFSGATTDDGLHLNEKGNDLVGHFVAGGIRSGAGLVVDPSYVAPIVYDFANPTFDKVPSGSNDWQRSAQTQWVISGNGDATITDAVATSNQQDLWFFQTVPLEVGKQYKIVLDATVSAGAIVVNINPSGSTSDLALLPGPGNAPFTATASSALVIFKATAGTTATIRAVKISLFVAAGGSVGLFKNSNFGDVPDGTATNWRTYPGWTVNGDGQAVLDSSQTQNGQTYLFQSVGNLDVSKQYRLRVRGQLNSGATLALHDYGAVGIGQDLVFTPHSASELFIIDGNGTGYLSNAILALDDANFPTT